MSPPPPVTAFDALDRIAPDRPALTWEDRTWTFGALTDHSARLAQTLHDRGVRAGDIIAVVADSHPATCLVWLAAARMGAVVSLLNAQLTRDELTPLLDRLAPRLLFHDAAHAERIAGLPWPAEAIAGLLEPVNAAPYAGPHPAADDLHEICFTSGTTAQPKGVELTHRIIADRARQEAALMRLAPDEVSLAVAPLFHQSGIRNSVFAPWTRGGHVVLRPGFRAAGFWADAQAHGATYSCMVETMMLLLLDRPPSPGDRSHRLRRIMGVGTADTLAAFEARFGVRCVQVWGMSENGVALGVPLDVPADALDSLRRFAPSASLAGWPLDGVELRLMADGGPVDPAANAEGEIHVRSLGLARGYWGDPHATARAFADGWQITGDMGRYGPDGAVFFLDRKADIIRRGGENIAPRQVEDVIRALPGVRDVAVVPHPDPVFLQELRAVIVRGADGPDAAAVWEWCAARLARFKVPRYVEFRDALPRNASGRLQKHLLRPDATPADAFHDRLAGTHP